MAREVIFKSRAPQRGETPEIYVAGQWQLMWWRFKKHRVAFASGIIVAAFYLIAAFCEFLAPRNLEYYSSRYVYAPPQRLHLFLREEGRLRLAPHVYGYASRLDPVSLRRTYTADPQQVIPVRFFAKGDPYRLWGLLPARRHLIAPVDPAAPLLLFGADRLGRDVFSRVLYGSRVSLSIGLVGVFLSLFLGILLGGISGYCGGVVDDAIQRVIEFLKAIPTIPLWMGLAAAIPPDWPPLRVYFGITVILAMVGWTGMARVVRGKFYSLKNEDFVIAARLDGCPRTRIILRHMVPSFLSHIIASVTLSIPGMILSETSLSFLGIGLQPPVVSWGVLLNDAQNIRAISGAPWLLFAPGLCVIVTVLCMNFLGDGLRDAADPYST